MTIKERYAGVMNWFEKEQPVAKTELTYSNPYQLLVAVILSAQCTDKRVNLVTPVFFTRFPDVFVLASADTEEIFSLIASCSYPNNKAKHLSGMARILVRDFGGVVPSGREDLMKLPGVGRKTANVIASVVFNQPAMAVDTHVFRVSARIGLTVGAKTPYEAEMQLIRHIPENQIPIAHHWLILHGRYTCTARNPKCEECGIRAFCRFYSGLTRINA